MDWAYKKDHKLFIVFVDFSKAYDRLPRNRLLDTLRRLGCGAVMLGKYSSDVDKYSSYVDKYSSYVDKYSSYVDKYSSYHD